jgi:hypothetical protein
MTFKEKAIHHREHRDHREKKKILYGNQEKRSGTHE